MKKLIVIKENYTPFGYHAYLDRGKSIPRPKGSKYFPGQVVYEIDNNTIGVVLGCIDESFGELRTDSNGMRPIETVRPATMEDFNIEGVHFTPYLKAECEGKVVHYDWNTFEATIEEKEDF